MNAINRKSNKPIFSTLKREIQNNCYYLKSTNFKNTIKHSDCLAEILSFDIFKYIL